MSYRHGAAGLVFALLALSTSAQLLEHHTGPDLGSSARAEESPAPAPVVDVTGVWFHLQQNDLAAARAEYQRLVAEHPGWQAPEALQAALENTPRQSAKTDSPPGDEDRLLGWERLAEGQPEKALVAFDRALARGTSSAKDAWHGRVRALMALGRLAAARQAAIDAGILDRVAADMAGLYQAKALANAVQYPVQALANARLADDLGADVWLPLGWRLLEAGHAEQAISAFEASRQSPDAPAGEVFYGLAQSQWRAGQSRQAVETACRNRQLDDRMARTCADLLLAQAGAAAQAEDWEQVLVVTRRQRDAGLASHESEMLRGWALYHRGDVSAARDLFARQYRAKPDESSAEALLIAGVGAGDSLSDIQGYSQGAGDPLQTIVLPRWRSDAAFAAGLFFAAERIQPGRHAMLAGVQSAALAVDTLGRYKQGEAGRDRVRGMRTGVQGQRTLQGGHRIAAGVEVTDFDHQGRPPLHSGDSWLQPWMSWSREGLPFSGSVQVGTTPQGSAISPVLLGSIAVRHQGEHILLDGRVFAGDRRDSLLSQAGQADPATGLNFGRVVETGVEGSATLLLGEGEGITGNVLGSRLTGHRVADNERLWLALSASRELPVSGFAHWRYGPYMHGQWYDRNLGHYTLGHGGYYSPQSYGAVGLQLDAMTHEGRGWLLGLRASAGWMRAKEAGEAIYPLSSLSPQLEGRYHSTENHGAAGNLQLRAGWLVGRHWLLTAGVEIAVAPDYREALAGLGLRYVFDGRPGLLRSDLPLWHPSRR